jgi:putative flippase GtrA
MLAGAEVWTRFKQRQDSSKIIMKNFLDALVAVLAGNALYYLLMPHLPAVAWHRLFQEDWGLLVDFAICTAIFAVVKYARRNEK